MKAMLQFIAAAVCVVVLTACGGGKKVTEAAAIVQPDYKLTTVATGSGTVAAAGDLITFKFTGYLYDSTKSDFKGSLVETSADYSGGTYTATVGVGALLTGWDRSLLGMQPGGKVTVILPAAYAYGSSSRDADKTKGYPAIPANSPMVYDFEMVNVTKGVYIVSTPAPSTTTTLSETVGTGDAVVANGNTVTVRYTGWLYDGTRTNRKGTQFDTNTASTDTALSVVVGSSSVVTGFSTGMIGMKVGGTRTIVIPASEAYGTTVKYDSSGVVLIPANSALVFDITVETIK